MTSFFHGRSVTFAALAFIIATAAAAHGLGFTMRARPPSTAFAVRTAIVCVLAFTVCTYATVNLVRALRRGYAPARGVLAAIILLLAWALSAWAGLGLLGLILDEKNVAAQSFQSDREPSNL
jgi:hypothetical protein